MKLAQLLQVVQVVLHQNHISETARSLRTSQSSISGNIKLLEDELGFPIFERKRNCIVGLTDAGREAVAIAQRISGDVDNLKRLGAETTNDAQTELTIATTRTVARYVLPPVVEQFLVRHPNVQLRLRQGNPTRICEMVESGAADLAIGSETTTPFPTLVRFSSHTLPRSVIAKSGHPLVRIRKPTLEQVARYPIITYDPAYSGRWMLLDAFKKAGIEPNVILGAVDADVCKTYVELGLGIAVLATVTYDRKRDHGIAGIDASHLFGPSTLYVALRSGSYLRGSTYDLIEAFDARLDRAAIDRGL